MEATYGVSHRGEDLLVDWTGLQYRSGAVDEWVGVAVLL